MRDKTDHSALAGQVVALLDPAAQLEQKEVGFGQTFCVTLPGGAGCFLMRFDNWGREGKLDISGVYPRYKEYRRDGLTQNEWHDSFSVGFSHSRSAEDIAKGIKRRFLPTYAEILAKAREGCDARTKRALAEKELTEHVRDRLSEFSFSRDGFSLSLKGASVRGDDGASVSLELNWLTRDQFDAVMDTLKLFIKAEKPGP